MKEREVIETKPVIKYDVSLARIGTLKEKYMPLVITDLEDQEQFELVHDARMTMVKIRTTIEKARKEQKSAALAYGKKVDAAAKERVDAAAPIEAHLQVEEKKVTDEQKRIEKEKLDEFRAMVQGRVDAFMAYGVVLSFADVAEMNDAEFDMKLVGVKTDYENEQQRLAKEEQERIDRQAELDRQAEEQAKRDRERAAEEEVLRIERQALQAEDARIKAEQDAKDEILRKEQDAKAEKAEAARKEAMKPAREKLRAISKGFAGYIFPDVSSDEAENILVEAKRRINEVAKFIQHESEEM